MCVVLRDLFNYFAFRGFPILDLANLKNSLSENIGRKLKGEKSERKMEGYSNRMPSGDEYRIVPCRLFIAAVDEAVSCMKFSHKLGAKVNINV